MQHAISEWHNQFLKLISPTYPPPPPPFSTPSVIVSPERNHMIPSQEKKKSMIPALQELVKYFQFSAGNYCSSQLV